MKVITICGSMKFISDIMVWSEKLELMGNCVLAVIYPTKPIETYTFQEKAQFDIAHKKKIKLSDAIFVINKGGYIGNSTRAEIEYAKQLNKEIIYMENP